METAARHQTRNFGRTWISILGEAGNPGAAVELQGAWDMLGRATFPEVPGRQE